jgi:hypothetical protein
MAIEKFHVVIWGLVLKFGRLSLRSAFRSKVSIEESLVNQFLSKRSLLALAALLIGILLVIYFGPASQLTPARAPLTEIRSIETLRNQFNRDAGKIRLIMLLSPT